MLMTAQYYKRQAESEFGSGVCYFELEAGWIARQVEHYGEIWRWGDDEHPEWLADHPQSELGLEEATTISSAEFEMAWEQARTRWQPGS